MLALSLTYGVPSLFLLVDFAHAALYAEGFDAVGCPALVDSRTFWVNRHVWAWIWFVVKIGTFVDDVVAYQPCCLACTDLVLEAAQAGVPDNFESVR